MKIPPKPPCRASNIQRAIARDAKNARRDRFVTEPIRDFAGHNKDQLYGGSTKASLRVAEQLVDEADKKIMPLKQRSSCLIDRIVKVMKEFKLGASLRRLIRKIPGIARFLGPGVAVWAYIADSSPAHAATIPRWVNHFYRLKRTFKKSNDPIQKLECLRKMCAMMHSMQEDVERRFKASLLGARQVYSESPGQREKLVREMLPVFVGFRQTNGQIAYILQDLCSATGPLITATQSAYGWNSQVVVRLRNYRTYFRTFREASNRCARSSAQLVPDRINVTRELSKQISVAM